MTIRILFGTTGWPCGLHEVASQVVRLGLAEAMILPLGELFDRTLRDFRPHLVGLRIEGGQSEAVRESIAAIRRRIDTTIVLGGPTATSHPVEVLETTDADYVFAGDAEIPLTKFLQAAQSTNLRDLATEIPGLAYRWGEHTVVNLPKEDLCNGREVPQVDEETLRTNRLNWSLLEGFTQPLDSLYFTGGRGCPGRCTFCARLHGSRVRTKTARQLIDEIRDADRLVREGRLKLNRWNLYAETEDAARQSSVVAWCAVFDEDFFLDKKRAVEFLQLWDFYRLGERYRLNFQTNPCSLLDRTDEADRAIFHWISRTKSMIQLGAESFHPALLRRWNKRHTTEQLETVLTALDATGQDYNVFHLQTDYRTTLDELLESSDLLLRATKRHQRMRIASSPLTIPLYDTDIRRELEYTGKFRAKDFTAYETPCPELLSPDVLELAERLDEALQGALHLPSRAEALGNVDDLLGRQVDRYNSGSRFESNRNPMTDHELAVSEEVSVGRR